MPELAWLGASLKALVVPAVGERPIPLKLGTPGITGERGLDVRPGRIPVPVRTKNLIRPANAA
jgi:hypothetical protein